MTWIAGSRTEGGRTRAAAPGVQRAVAAALTVLLVVLQLGPLPAALDTALGAHGDHGGAHPCGCTGPVCVCPHGAAAGEAEGASCRLPGRGAEPVPAFESCQEPPEEGALTALAVLPTPVALPGPALRDRLVATGPGWPAAPSGGLDPPPPKRSSAA
ncbi:MAG: hypothetical protein ACLF0P_06175 [Thermoanaerobaculia bacterium]